MVKRTPTNRKLINLIGFVKIAARDCLFIGKHAFNKGLYDQAIEWLQQAAKLASLEMDPSANVGEIQPFLTTAIRVVRTLEK